jgi:hypothetical protein
MLSPLSLFLELSRLVVMLMGLMGLACAFGGVVFKEAVKEEGERDEAAPASSFLVGGGGYKSNATFSLPLLFSALVFRFSFSGGEGDWCFFFVEGGGETDRKALLMKEWRMPVL